MRIIQLHIMHEEWDEIFIVQFIVFKLQVTVTTDGCDVLYGNVAVMLRLDVSDSEGLFACETVCCGVVGSGLFVGSGVGR